MKHGERGEGDFQVESSMSLGNTHWCRVSQPQCRSTPFEDFDYSQQASNVERHPMDIDQHPSETSASVDRRQLNSDRYSASGDQYPDSVGRHHLEEYGSESMIYEQASEGKVSI